MKRPVCIDCIHYESSGEYAKRIGCHKSEMESTGGCNLDNVVRSIYHPVTSGCGQHHDFGRYMKWFKKQLKSPWCKFWR